MSRAPITIFCDGGVLRPADAYAQEQIAQLPMGATFNARLSRITAKGKEEREGLRGLWWAGCDLLAQNTEEPGYYSKRAASDSILDAIGATRRRYRADKTWENIPISLADDALPDEEMASLLELARAWCHKHFGFDPWQSWIDEQEAMKAARGNR